MALFGLDLPTLAHALVRSKAGAKAGQLAREDRERESSRQAMADYIEKERLRILKERNKRERGEARRRQEVHEAAYGRGGKAGSLEGRFNYHLTGLDPEEAHRLRAVYESGQMSLTDAAEEAERAFRQKQSFDAYYGRTVTREGFREPAERRAEMSALQRAMAFLYDLDETGRYEQPGGQQLLMKEAQTLLDERQMPSDAPPEPTVFQEMGINEPPTGEEMANMTAEERADVAAKVEELLRSQDERITPHGEPMVNLQHFLEAYISAGRPDLAKLLRQVYAQQSTMSGAAGMSGAAETPRLHEFE